MERIDQKKETFNQVLTTLNQIIGTFKPDETDPITQNILCSSLIKHFELAFETGWKFLQAILRYRLAKTFASPRAVFTEAQAQNMITTEQLVSLLSILDDRNFTTHEYAKDAALEICKKIITQYYPTLKSLLLIPSNEPLG